MDISQIASASSLLSSARTGDAVQMAVLKRALDIQSQGAAQLVAVAAAAAPDPEATVGRNIDVYA